MTRTGTKTTMKRQPVKKTKMDKVYADVQKFTKDKKVADALITKYGVDGAYAIVRQCMQEPANVIKRINSKSEIWKTSDAIKYFASSNLTDQQVATGIKKTTQFVKTSRNTKNNTPQAVESQKIVKKKTQQPSKEQASKVSSQTGQKKTNNSPTVSSKVAPKIPNLVEELKNQQIFTPQMPSNNTTAKPAEQAKVKYDQMMQNHQGNLTVEELMQAGVNSADIQAVLGENKEYFAKLQPGKTNKDLARRANRVTGNCSGGCLAGVQRMYPALGGSNPNWPKKEYGSSANSACNAHEVLEKSGKFVTVEIKNLAYGKGMGSPEEIKMRKLNSGLPAGTIVSLDNKKADELQGRRTPSSNSEKHGHIWVQDDRGHACSDGRQPEGPRFSRYGKTMFVSVAKDCSVPSEIAEKLIQRSLERQEKERQVALAKNRATRSNG